MYGNRHLCVTRLVGRERIVDIIADGSAEKILLC